MAFNDSEILDAIDNEIGTVLAPLATDAEKLRWFNEGVNRLAAGVSRYKPNYVDFEWTAGQRSVALSTDITGDLRTDFIEIDKIVTDAGSVPQPWRVMGMVELATLYLDDPDGATQAGSARLWYWSQWELITLCVAAANTVSPTLTPGAQGLDEVWYSDVGTWVGDATITYTYQWEVSDDDAIWVEIAGADSDAILPTDWPGDIAIGQYLRVVVTGTNACGTDSAPSDSYPIACNPPVNTVAPEITPGFGDHTVEQTVSDGTWTGDPTITYAYQWQESANDVDWSDIVGATLNTMTPIDEGMVGGEFFRCIIIATNDCDVSYAYTSSWELDADPPPPCNPPVNTVAPALAETTFFSYDAPFTCGTGTWTGDATITYTYQWQVQNEGVGAWANIGGFTTNTFDPGTYGGDANDKVRCIVTATNDCDTASATSNSATEVAE